MSLFPSLDIFGLRNYIIFLVLPSLNFNFYLSGSSFPIVFFCFLFLQLLSDDPALTKFRSYKPSVRKIKKIGDALTIVVAAGIFIYINNFLSYFGIKSNCISLISC